VFITIIGTLYTVLGTLTAIPRPTWHSTLAPWDDKMGINYSTE